MNIKIDAINIETASKEELKRRNQRGSGLDVEYISSRYNLSEKQREVLVQNNQPTARVRRSIVKKRDHIPERLQHLFNEIAVLSESGFLDRQEWNNDGKVAEASSYENWAEFWSDLSDIRIRKEHSRYKEVMFRSEERDNDDVQFGFDLGTVIRMLKSESEFGNQNHDLLWGIILAFVGQPPVEMNDESGNFVELFDDLKQRQRERQTTASKYNMGDFVPRKEKFRTAIKDGISATGIEPAPSVVDIVYSKVEIPGSDDDEVNRGIVYHGAKDATNQLREEVRLDEVNSLFTNLREDLNAVKEHSTPGVQKAEDLLKYLWIANEYVSDKGEDTDDIKSLPLQSDTIAEEYHCSPKNVSETLNNISGESEWTSTAIVYEGNSTGSAGPWYLTQYGKLLCYCRFETDSNTIWIFDHALQASTMGLRRRKLVTDALIETGIVES
jgi:hypothetical protein